MTRQEKMLSLHSQALSSVLGEKFIKNKFKTYIPEGNVNNDTVISDCKDKRLAFITRHLLTCEPTHSIVLENDTYERL